MDFDKIYNGQTTLAPRSRTCANAALDRLPYAVGRLYVENFFDENSKIQVNLYFIQTSLMLMFKLKETILKKGG